MFGLRQIWNETIVVNTCTSFGYKHTFAATFQNGVYLPFLGILWRSFRSLALLGTPKIF
jgi:hypothetical protein